MSKELIVVKYGSESCTDLSGVRADRLEHYAGQIAEQQAMGRDVIAVISGSIAVAKTLLPDSMVRSDGVSQQMLATHGNSHFFSSWQHALRVEGLIGGELLVTSHDINDRSESQMLSKTIKEQLAAGWVSLINENDGLSDEEVKTLAYGGDNDGLASHLAIRLNASRLLLLTEKNGLLDENGKVIHKVDGNNLSKALRLAKGPGPLGRGGMKTKVNAARITSQNRIPTHIAHAESRISDVINHRTGTLFVPPYRAV